MKRWRERCLICSKLFPIDEVQSVVCLCCQRQLKTEGALNDKDGAN